MTEALDADSAADTTVDVTPEAPAEAAPKTSRAGRDLKAAIGVGVGLGALVLGSLLVVKQVFLVILVAAVGLGAWEMRRALASARIQVPLIPVLLGAVSMLLAAYVRGAEALALTFALTCVGIVVWRAAEGTAGALRDSFGGFFVAAYPCLIAGFASLLLAEPDGHLRIIFFILVTVFSDIGGYAVGVLFGKHPMAPRISPKKSWEGFAGSVLTCAVAGAACLVLFFDQPWWAGVVLGAVVAACATIGDLMESVIKRNLGIKDMSNLLPGHGGLMDRLDSLIMTAPLCWAVLHYVVGS